MSAEKSFLNQLETQEVERKLNRIPAYIRLLSFGKLAIGAMVLILIAAVVVVPFVKSEDDGVRIALTQVDEATKVTRPIMKNPRYESVDGDGQPFTIRAHEAMQMDESNVQLNQIKADVSMNNGMWLALTAKQGKLDIDAQKMQLTQQVHLIANNGYELRTEKLNVDMKTSRAYGNQPVSGQGPMGHIKADEFLIEGEASRVLFTDNVKLVIYP